MENKKQSHVSSSASSFTSDLFGAKSNTTNTTLPSKGIFSSLFPRPSKDATNNSSTSLFGAVNKQPIGGQSLKVGTQGHMNKIRQGTNSFMSNKEMFPGRETTCPLSSSLYYGGQDMYQSSTIHTSEQFTKFNKSLGENYHSGDNSSGDARGNWWEGSLYY